MADKMGLSLTEHALYKDVIRGPVSYSHYSSASFLDSQDIDTQPISESCMIYINTFTAVTGYIER